MVLPFLLILLITKSFEEGRAVADKPPTDGSDSTKGENQNLATIFFLSSVLQVELSHFCLVKLYSHDCFMWKMIV